jgi:hypothetical protein
MPRPTPHTSTGPLAPLWLRLTVVLLAVVQVVAPSWHICELGGNTGASYPACHVPGTPSAGAPTGGVLAAVTEQEITPEAAAALAAAPWLTGLPEDCASSSCLARLLMGMPGSIAHSTALTVVFEDPQSPTVATLRLASIAALPQPPSRGPPAFSPVV